MTKDALIIRLKQRISWFKKRADEETLKGNWHEVAINSAKREEAEQALEMVESLHIQSTPILGAVS